MKPSLTRVFLPILSALALAGISACDYTPRNPGYVCGEQYCGPTGPGYPYKSSAANPAQIDDFSAWVANHYQISERSARTLVEAAAGMNREANLHELGLSEAQAAELTRSTPTAATLEQLTGALGESPEHLGAILSDFRATTANR